MAVTFKLYENYGETGESLVYTFPTIFSANYPHSEKKYIEHTNLRGKGSITINGGESSWDLILKGVLKASNYATLMILIDAMESLVELNTPFTLGIENTEAETGDIEYFYKVKRITPIEYPEDNLRTDFIEYRVTFLVNSW
jgi:hypothetical protein